MNRKPATFNLIDEAWIPCLMLDGTTETLTLRSVFRRAGDVREISGELPTQDFAMLRVLLAIMYSAVETNAFGTSTWRAWWETGLPLADLDDYLDEFHDRFDLLDQERPFFQVADLHTSKHEVKTPATLILDVPSKENKYFTTRDGAALKSLSLPEAARWLICIHAFDFAGIKSGAVGDPRVNGGRGYGIGTGWAGRIGGVIIQGGTLAETLLLNFAPDSDYTSDWSHDAPGWERDIPYSSTTRKRPDTQTPEGVDDPDPTGPADLYTWQSRRVRLHVEDGRVTGVVLAQGDPAPPQNRQGLEPMTAWRYSDPQTKKFKTDVYMPREHRPERAFWRGVAGLVPALGDHGTGKEARRFIAPITIYWLSRLQAAGALSPDHVVRLQAVGVVYGSNESVIDDVIHDRMLVPLALLRADQPELKHLVETAVQLTEEGVLTLKKLAGNLAAAAGGETEGPRSRAEAVAFSELDFPFRRWLADLTGEADTGAALERWRVQLRSTLTNAGRRLVRAASPAARLGREVSGFKGSTLITTARAESWFETSLRTLLPTTPTPPASQKESSSS